MKFHFRQHHQHHDACGAVVVPENVRGRCGSEGEVATDPLDETLYLGTAVLPSSPSPVEAMEVATPPAGDQDKAEGRAEGQGEDPRNSAAFHLGRCAASSAAGRHFRTKEPEDDGRTRHPRASRASRAETKGGAEDKAEKASSPKRALVLEGHESECPAANPDPHSRPRSRQFFRLGRNRRRASDGSSAISSAVSSNASSSSVVSSSVTSSTSSTSTAPMVSDSSCSSEDEVPAARTRGQSTSPRVGRRWKPRMRRHASVPARIGAEGPEPLETDQGQDKPELEEPGQGVDDQPPSVEISSSFSTDELDIAREAAASAVPDRLSCSEVTSRTARHRRRPHRRSCPAGVAFDLVQVREYTTVLGDHPCCSSGPPLALGWTTVRETEVEVDKYEEELRDALASSGRRKGGMRLTGDERRDILRGVAGGASPAGPSSSVASPEASDDDVNLANPSDDAASEPRSKVYTSSELRRAERRLMRDRAGRNARACRRMNDKFFRAPTPPPPKPTTFDEIDAPVASAEEEDAGGVAPMDEEAEAMGDEAEEGAAESGMDASPAELLTIE
ncbi:hypothetical protein ACHAWF_005231 [Thalassiosira exigua]